MRQLVLAAFLLAALPILHACAARSAASPDPMTLPVCPDSLQANPQATPTVTPMAVRPQLTNNRTVARLLAAYYPPMYRDQGIGGTTNVWFLIRPDGTVGSASVARSSGYPAFDSAAVRLAERMEFEPAMRLRPGDGCRLQVWVALDVTFEVQR